MQNTVFDHFFYLKNYISSTNKTERAKHILFSQMYTAPRKKRCIETELERRDIYRKVELKLVKPILTQIGNECKKYSFEEDIIYLLEFKDDPVQIWKYDLNIKWSSNTINCMCK